MLATISGSVIILLDENINSPWLYNKLTNELKFTVYTMQQAGLPVRDGTPDPSFIEWARSRGAHVLTRNAKHFIGQYDRLIIGHGQWKKEELFRRMVALREYSKQNPAIWTWPTIKLISFRFEPFLPPLYSSFFFIIPEFWLKEYRKFIDRPIVRTEYAA